MDFDEKLDEEAIPKEVTFEFIWNTFISSLEGNSFVNSQGFENKVLKVTDAYILKESANGKQSKVKKDLFKWIVDRIRHYGFAQAIDLRNEFHSQASSFVTLIFAQIPMFKVTYNPRCIKFNDQYKL